jgi:hypothetical protein
VAGEFAGAGSGELRALEIGEEELGDGGRGHRYGDIGEAVGSGGLGGEAGEFVEGREGDAGFEGEAERVNELGVGLGGAGLEGEDKRGGPRLRVCALYRAQANP